MTKNQAVAECQRYVQKNKTGAQRIEFGYDVQAHKEDRFWEVRGTTQFGSYRCTVDAVKHEAFSALFDSPRS